VIGIEATDLNVLYWPLEEGILYLFCLAFGC